MGQDDFWRGGGQFRRMSANLGGIGRCPAGVDPHVAPCGPAQLPQALQERPDQGLKIRIVRSRGYDHADAPHALALLRARRERPRRRRPTDERYELPAPHSITSSARASTVGGMSKSMPLPSRG